MRNHIEMEQFASDFLNLADRLRSTNQKMLITMHRFPDADAFGSAVALALIMKKLGVEAKLLAVPFVPFKLKFLFLINHVNTIEPMKIGKKGIQGSYNEWVLNYFSDTIDQYDAMAVLDCAGVSQIPEESRLIGKDLPFKLNIDHHVGYRLDHSSALNLVMDVSSTCEIIYSLMKEINMEIDSDIAVPLYVGIISDLRKNEISKHSPKFPQNVLQELENQAKQIGYGIRKLVKVIFSLDDWERNLLKITLADARYHDKIVYLKFNRNTVKKAKTMADALDNPRMPFHEFHIKLRHRLKLFKNKCRVVVVFDQILNKVSLQHLHRSATDDLSQIACELGDGGGHRNRSGFNIKQAGKKLLKSNRINHELTDDQLMEKLIPIIANKLS